MTKVYVAIDNGTSGGIAIIKDGFADMVKTPIFKTLSYTKTKQEITRIDFMALTNILQSAVAKDDGGGILVIIERPCINPTRFKTTVSAARSLEATLIAIELLKLPFMYCDSKDWQRVLLPSGSEDTKKDSREIGTRLFPHLSDIIKKQKDADSLLMGEWARRNNL